MVIIAAVKRENFKRCDQSGFCRRNRAYADAVSSVGSGWSSPYVLDPKTIKVKKGQLTGSILKSVRESQSPIALPITILFQEGGVARITIDEARRQQGDIELRHNSPAKKERYNEVGSWALIGQPRGDSSVKEETSEKETIVSYGPDNKYKAIIRHQPFSIDFQRDNEVHVRFNANGLMNYEHWRPKIEKENNEAEEPKEGEQVVEAKEEEETEDESTWWEEAFGGNTDTKPKGPESVGMDITFPSYPHVYGIPGHTGPLSLKETR